ncbi:MAG: AMP-binding protein [Pseudomonadota bacterium]
MERIWLNEYAPGIPAKIPPSGHASLRDLLEAGFAQFGARSAYQNMGVSLSYGRLDVLSRDLAAFLQHRGLEKGDRVAIMLPNVLQYPIALCAVLRAGLVAVNVNPLYSPRELRHQLADSGASAIVIMENFAATLEAVLDDTAIATVITTELGDLFPPPKRLLTNFVVKRVRKLVPPFGIPQRIGFLKALRRGKPMPLQRVDIAPEDLAFLQYTGGTTGLAKGAMLSHRNMVANVQQSCAWLGNALGHDEDIIAITALPLYHIFSLEGNCLSIMYLGGMSVLITNPRDFPAFVKELKRHRFTYFTGVNTLFSALLATPGFDSLDFSGLKITIGGGMAVTEAVAKRWKEVTGNTLTQAYGLTETSPAAVINPLTPGAEFNRSIGLPISSTEVSIRDDDGNELPLGEIGEICIRGPQVMEGYWQNDEETRKVMFGDWLRTGDMGRMDERGYVFVEDRKKDMIVVSGFNVYPNEIEDVVASLHGVLEAAVIGVPDERSGEAVKLFVSRSDLTLTVETVMSHCRQHLTGYKRPKQIEFREELPKTNVGKVLRRALREESSNSTAR